MTKKKKTTGYWCLEILAIVIAVLFLVPIAWMLGASFKNPHKPVHNILEYFLPPFTLSNYATVLSKSKVYRWFLNSTVTSVTATAFAVLFCAMASYAFSKLVFRGKKALYNYLLLGLMIPTEATIVSLYILCRDLGMLNSYIGLILPVLASSMNVIIMTNFFKTIPNDLVDAARIDGSNEFGIFMNVILPLGKSVIISVSIFIFIRQWNNFLWPYLCASQENMFTLTVGVPSFINANDETVNMPMTISAIASMPLLIMYIFFNKQIVKGIALTGIKD